jgi:tetratricopeptide (TPR) repeat protein
MINLLVSFGISFASVVLFRALNFSLIASLVPGVFAFLIAYLVLGRRTFMQLQAIGSKVQAELSAISGNPKEQKVRVEKAIKMWENALPLGNWQFLIRGQIYAQIGTLRYLFKDHEGAMAAFNKSSPRDYFARAMQGAIFFQRKDLGNMQKAFEDAVKFGKKESLMWAAYAWCLVQNRENDKALQILGRAVETNPADDKLKKALTDLQNDKRLKMKAWEPMWWNLGLETPPMQQPQFLQAGGRRRFIRR